MRQNVASRPSAPECQLSKIGTPESYARLLLATRAMSEKHLQELEEDISFYEKTGLIGVRMSWMLTLVDRERQDKVA